MVAFDSLGRIKRYESPLEMLKEYYYVRLEYYQRRKDHISEELTNQLTKLSEQARFIKLIIEKQLSVSNKKRAILVELLQKFKFIPIDKKGNPIKDIKIENVVVEHDKAEEMLDEDEENYEGDLSQINISQATGAGNEDGEQEYKPLTIFSTYDYLLGMPIWSLTRERYEKLLQLRDTKQEELTNLLRLSAKDLWNNDLDDFLVSWEKFLEEDLADRMTEVPQKGSKKKAKRSRAPAAAKKSTVKEEEDDVEYPPRKKPATKKKVSPTPTTTAIKMEEVVPSIPEAPKKAAPKIKSLFDDSDDDELLGDSFTHSSPPNVTKSATVTPAPKTYKPSSSTLTSASSKKKDDETVKPTSKKKKLTIEDELADLNDTAFKDAEEPRRRKQLSKKTPVYDEISDEDMEDSESNAEVDDDDESDYEE